MAGNWNTSCTTPDNNTPHAMANTGCSNHGTATVAARIKVIFIRIGVAAAAAKRSYVFSTELAKPVMVIKNKYGNVMRNMSLVRPKRSGSCNQKPGANKMVNHGEANTTNALTASEVPPNTP